MSVSGNAGQLSESRILSETWRRLRLNYSDIRWWNIYKYECDELLANKLKTNAFQGDDEATAENEKSRTGDNIAKR